MAFKVVDGGFSTELELRGFQFGDDPLWSARVIYTNPEEIKKVHTSFLESGADIIESGTYQASVYGFQKYLGLSVDESKQLVAKGIQLAKESRDEFWEDCKRSGADKDRCYPLVAGCVGPYAVKVLNVEEYSGTYVDTTSISELINWHRETVDVIVNTGIDYLAFETVPALKEAEAIVQLLQEYPSTKAWISFSCKDGEHTCHGEKFSDAVKVAASSPSVVAVGINCTPPQYIKSLLKSSENEIGDKIFVVYPNGASYIGGGLWKKNENNKNLCAYVPDWINAGANWIGGCCMIGSQQIQDIRQAMVDTIAK